MKLLHIDSSILKEQSASRQLTVAIAKHLIHITTGIEAIHYDLCAEPIGHLSAAEFLAFKGVEPGDAAAQREVARNTQLLCDFLAADVIIVGAPMYNFSLPSQLKAWLDRIAVAGKTFHYTENGVEGLARGKRVIVASTRGGFYNNGALDHQETYLRGFFAFLGIADITFIRAEGLAFGPDKRNAAIESAVAQIEKLVA
ncbi:NAD(P)H-dependent oxidoreductase [Pseudomonas tolaasii]|uniref:FMN dependent NADH:quinone oxidoreductase n=2 Tax=Pseudomonas tolaasii TaxID=29442 RepID=A0A7Y8AHV3_PSETO|nr:NAD(P)H-dependent oxidoreductase [Pseudomonas tolaasii]ARB30203.1 FMN-dependent NADH-azoreductase [Pseudomonas tolaasii]KAB0466397.1 FMN-dependent NADH-azoreductase [Pseudomonas tolaasii]MBW1247784.1 NAD(P)H-dependent oxidoreductase [Pseudomonas tolaasii]MBW4793068.1 NAD(P)H-dependent oxidoreductase [Pseudomonas tolaasii]MBY8941944.1 NAD(P)H-dependent oxidoreductase [Pseudomonas tolaasii]